MSFEYYTDELYHHGVIGQKWGQRRYQNDDGTLTAAGKEHYAKQDAADQKYRDKEIAKLDKSYGKQLKKTGKALTKAENYYKDVMWKGDEKHISKAKDRLETAYITNSLTDKHYKAERNAISKYSHDDISAEKSYIHKTTADCIKKSLAYSIPLALVGVRYYSIPNIPAVKRSMRVSAAEATKIGDAVEEELKRGAQYQ